MASCGGRGSALGRTALARGHKLLERIRQFIQRSSNEENLHVVFLDIAGDELENVLHDLATTEQPQQIAATAGTQAEEVARLKAQLEAAGAVTAAKAEEVARLKAQLEAAEVRRPRRRRWRA